MSSCPQTPHVQSFQPVPTFSPTAPPVFIDALQFGIAIKTDFYFTEGDRPNRPYLTGYMCDYFQRSEFFFSDKGFVRLGTNLGRNGHYRLCTNGARLSRRLLGLPDPLPRCRKEEEKLSNQLSEEERRQLITLAGAHEPWEQTAQQLPPLLKEAHNQVLSKIREITPFFSYVPALKVGIPIYRIEFYREYQLAPKRINEVLEEMTRSIARRLGYQQTEKQWSRIWKRDGVLRRWEYQFRKSEEFKRKKSEKVFLKLYSKGDYMRLEVEYENPSTHVVPPEEPEKILPEIYRIAADAREKLDKIHEQLNIQPIEISSKDLFDALANYGVRRPRHSKDWEEFVEQVTETECYDVTKASLSGFKIDSRTLGKKLAHPDFGMLERHSKDAVNGKSTRSVFRLRPDYRDRSLKYLCHVADQKLMAISKAQLILDCPGVIK